MRSGPPLPIELLKLRSATTVFLAMLVDVDQWAEQAADVSRIVEPDFAGQLDQLRDQIRAAASQDRNGSPARIAHWLAVLLDEA